MSNFNGIFWEVILGGFFCGRAQNLSIENIESLFSRELVSPTDGSLTLLKPGFEAFEQGVRGIAISFCLKLTDVLGKDIEVGLYFVTQGGSTIKTYFNHFALSDGTCAIGRRFNSNSFNFKINERLFIPYGILKLEKTQLIGGKVYVYINDDRKIILTRTFNFEYFVYEKNRREYNSAPQINELDAIIGLIAIVIRADNITAKEEILTVIRFFQGRQDINLDLVREKLRRYLEKPPNLEEYCDKLKNTETQRKYIIVSLLLNISVSDGYVDHRELEVINRIASLFNISDADFSKMKDVFVSEKQKAYELLGLKMGASNDLVKSAYKRLYNEFSPEKHINLSPNVKQVLKEHRDNIQVAFEMINNS